MTPIGQVVVKVVLKIKSIVTKKFTIVEMTNCYWRKKK